MACDAVRIHELVKSVQLIGLKSTVLLAIHMGFK